jgi:hypothetical protein
MAMGRQALPGEKKKKLPRTWSQESLLSSSRITQPSAILRPSLPPEEGGITASTKGKPTKHTKNVEGRIGREVCKHLLGDKDSSIGGPEDEIVSSKGAKTCIFYICLHALQRQTDKDNTLCTLPL